MPIGIHTHNDCELAVANTLAAVNAGATQVQGTINGYGERCGNANLCSIIPNLQLKMNHNVLPPEKLAMLTNTARYISEVANVHMPVGQPYVGNAAFAHKGGIHVSAIMKDSSTYEHIVPELVGNKQRVLVSELAGQSNIISKASALGLNVNTNNEKTKKIMDHIKQLEHEGYQFEAADASLELLLRKAFGDWKPAFQVESYKVHTESKQDQIISEAVVKINIDGKQIYTVAEGNGPVNALDTALRKALAQHYPDIEHVYLTDYKVRVIDETDATAAKVRVLVESTGKQHSWNTVGLSGNVIDASWDAIVDSLHYALLSLQKVNIDAPAQVSQDFVGLTNI